MSQINYKGREINSTSVPFDYILTSWVTIVQFRIRHDRCIKALTTHLYRVSLDLKKIFKNTGAKVPQIWKLNNTQS